MNGKKMVAHAICGSINNYQLLLMFGYSDEYGYSQEKADELFAQAEKTFLEKKGLIGDNDMSQVFSIFSLLGYYGHAESLAYEGLMRKCGCGTIQSSYYAWNCFEKAVKIGGRTLLSSLAYYELGLMYKQGLEVNVDLLKARTLFMKAVAKDGNRQAFLQLEEVNDMLRKEKLL